MEAIAALICAIPTIWEILDDRKGENKAGKVRDAFIAVILYAIVALANWKLFETSVFKTLALTFAFRLAFFDYAIQYILIRRGVIVGHWWNYHGKTSYLDQKLSRIDWRVLMAVKVVVFGLALWWVLN